MVEVLQFTKVQMSTMIQKSTQRKYHQDWYQLTAFILLTLNPKKPLNVNIMDAVD